MLNTNRRTQTKITNVTNDFIEEHKLTTFKRASSNTSYLSYISEVTCLTFINQLNE